MDSRGFSIITPINKPNCIENAIKNYINQEIDRKELIVVINNSDININDFNNYIDKYKNIFIYKIDKPIKLGDALNYGINKSKYDFIARFDSDDYYGKFYLKEVDYTFKNHECDVVGKSKLYYYFEEFNKLICTGGIINNYSSKAAGATMCFDKKVFENIKFKSVSAGEDVLFFKDCIENKYKIFNTSQYNFLVFRSRDPNNHTWKMNTKQYIERCTEIKNNVKFEDCFDIVDKDVV